MNHLSLALCRRHIVSQKTALVARLSPRPWRIAPQLCQRTHYLSTTKSTSSTTTSLSTTTNNDAEVSLPSSAQLRRVMIQSALPMAGFGFMDQTIMIHAGNAIDCTIGVSLGLSTLAAAAVGQIVANTGGLIFGETLQQFFCGRFLWMEPPKLNAAQLSLKVVEKSRFMGTLFGLVAGCVLGLFNLLFIDTERSNDLKMTKALTESDFHPCEVYVNNQHVLSSKYQPATTLTICGPDMDGILAIILTALKEEGYSVVEMSAKPKENSSNGNGVSSKKIYEDIFVVRRKGEATKDEELVLLAKKLLKERLLVSTRDNDKHTKDE